MIETLYPADNSFGAGWLLMCNESFATRKTAFWSNLLDPKLQSPALFSILVYVQPRCITKYPLSSRPPPLFISTDCLSMLSFSIPLWYRVRVFQLHVWDSLQIPLVFWVEIISTL